MKNLNEIDIGLLLKETLKRYGKKNTIIVTVNGIVVIGLIVGGLLINNKFQNNFKSNNEQLTKLQMDELYANNNKKKIEDLKVKVAELDTDNYQRDLTIQTTDTLKAIEDLMVQYAFVNDEHKVEPAKTNKSLKELPINIEYIGSFDKSVKFIEELNSMKLPIALKNLKFYVNEDEYEDVEKSGNIKTSLTVIVTDDLMNVEKKGSKIQKDNLRNIFGYYVYKKKEEPQTEETETIDAYQEYLQQYTKDQIKTENQEKTAMQNKPGDTASMGVPSVSSTPQTTSENNVAPDTQPTSASNSLSPQTNNLNTDIKVDSTVTNEIGNQSR